MSAPASVSSTDENFLSIWVPRLSKAQPFILAGDILGRPTSLAWKDLIYLKVGEGETQRSSPKWSLLSDKVEFAVPVWMQPSSS